MFNWQLVLDGCLVIKWNKYLWLMDESKLKQDDVGRRTSVAAISDDDTEFDKGKEVKHVFLLTGEKLCKLWPLVLY